MLMILRTIPASLFDMLRSVSWLIFAGKLSGLVDMLRLENWLQATIDWPYHVLPLAFRIHGSRLPGYFSRASGLFAPRGGLVPKDI